MLLTIKGAGTARCAEESGFTGEVFKLGGYSLFLPLFGTVIVELNTRTLSQAFRNYSNLI